MNYLLICLISYLLGSIPTALILVKIITKKDVRSGESGNMGAMNTLRITKKEKGLVVAIFSFLFVWLFDCFKAAIAIHFSLKFNLNFITTITLSTFFVILGHNYPIWLKGKGGRGAACFMGILMYFRFSIFLYWLLIIFLSSLITEIIFRIFKHQQINSKIIFQSISDQIIGRLIGELIAIPIISLIEPKLFWPILFGSILIILRHQKRLSKQLSSL
ncbi:Glycerol-3-phosphate acyltransferase [bioreactor metagenome]|uniref:Glycerol-3-phosphate acyltransferase n=1 Tax=bioreactor metagenome TaxID=1076179 RepID=A0A644ZQE2_9ZZZZ